MSGGHSVTAGHHHDGDGAIHRLPPEVKIVATLVFVLAVVATPRGAAWAFAIDAALLAVVAAAAALPAGFIARRMRIELPFLAFALLLPVIGSSPRIEVMGLPLSQPGLWAGWNIAIKGTLGVFAAILLAGTTPVAELLRGLERLRVPRVLVAIAGFMVRYLDVLVGEADRMRVARLSRGDDPRWLWQARATATGAGALFVRSYERGERVHLAMLSRGYDGTIPVLHEHHAPPRAWLVASVVPALAVAVATFAVIGTPG